jgi:hypothetical protein
MNLQEHTQPGQLERYSFFWSEVRLLIAAIALFLGGIPPVLFLFRVPSLYGLISLLLTLAWVISGVASGYLLYRWYGQKMLFGKKETMDTVAFFVLAISGLNLGLAGILRTNIGMSISSNRFVLIIVGLLYLASAGYLYKRWMESGRKVF